MRWRLMFHLNRDGNEPPPCTRGNSSAHDLALEALFFGHVHVAQLRDVERMPINGELVVGKVEAQAISFFALKVRKARLLSILAWMFRSEERRVGKECRSRW